MLKIDDNHKKMMAKIVELKESNQSAKIEKRGKGKWYRFTYKPEYPKVTIKWLEKRAELPTREFVIELLIALFEYQELVNRSATGKMPPKCKTRGKNNVESKPAIDENRRLFIIGEYWR